MPVSPAAKSNWPVVTLITVILILGYAILAWSMNLWPFAASSEMAVSPTPTSSVSTTPDVTAGWKTYTNIAYGYSIQYPATWAVKVVFDSTQYSQNQVTIEGSEGSVSIYENADLGGGLCASSGGILTQIQTAAGSFMSCVDSRGMRSDSGDSSNLLSGKNKYALFATWNNSSKPEVLQILSTFKFSK